MSNILNSPPNACFILIAPAYCPEVIIEALTFTKPAEFTAETKSPASATVEPSRLVTVISFALDKELEPFTDSWILNLPCKPVG